ncbi:MAG: ATP-binding protein [Heliobacteriaceae bacterium]|nr:ATP-binding protein [Heliobacteriaceae bacterium]MDD4587130.1 ATP-binding protein [Heliobacteriaceae bacterium]
MQQIAVVSGKGGTGKTSLVAAFAGIAGSSVIADCDVDAANLHLVLRPTRERVTPEPFTSGFLAVLAEARCTGCGRCGPVCRFAAVLPGDGGKPAIDSLACEGCGACGDVCPEQALALTEKQAGMLFVSETKFGTLVRGKLGIAQASSGKLVNLVRSRAMEVAVQDRREIILIDGAPGIGCPVIATLSGVDAAVVVSEPTVSGHHDLERILALCRHFGRQAFVVINKWNINQEMAQEMEQVAVAQGAKLLGRIEFDPLFAQAVAAGKTILEQDADSIPARQVNQIWEKLTAGLKK